MKFDVKYYGSWTTNVSDIFKSGIEFWGEGWVFVNDTTLICQGNMPKFNLGGLAPLSQKVLYVSTTRTIPYATIIKYKKPSDLRQTHDITYRLPNRKKVTVNFQMTKSKKRHDEMFTSQLEEYLAVAQSFVSS